MGRAEGVQAALSRAGLELAAPVAFGRWGQRWGRHANDTLMSQGVEFDAIACGSDQIATGAADALIAAGRRVPSEGAVTGFDNWLEFAEEARPPLTTVDMNLEELGAAADRQLFGILDSEPAVAGVHGRPCRLVVRDSTSPVR